MFNFLKLDRLEAGMLALYVGSSVVDSVLIERKKAQTAQKKAFDAARAGAQKIVNDLTKQRDEIAQQIKDRDEAMIDPSKMTDQEWAALWHRL